MDHIHHTISQLFNDNKYTLAVKKLKKFNTKNPSNSETERLLGVAYIHLKNFQLAEKHLNKSLSLNSLAHATLLNLASLYKEQGRFDLAIEKIESVLNKEPNHIAALFNLGNIYRLMERWEQANSHYEKVLQLQPSHLPVMVTLGLMKKNAGDIDQAISYFHRALDLDPFNKSVYLSLANLKNYQFTDDEISIVSKIINQSTDAESIELLFAKAQYLEHTENFTEAFQYLERANSAQYKKLNRTATDWAAYSQRIETVFDQYESQDNPSKETTDEPQPLFIVSMPRSGSTLVEQIVASHSAVFGASELPTLPQIMKEMEQQQQLPYPEAWLQTNNSDRQMMAERYQQKINSYGTQYQYISDKNLNNFNYIGAILAAMPNSLFIHCTRHPLDVCLSCYKQLFAAGQEYSYDLDELAAYYKHHDHVMQYWKKRYPAQILTVNYEEMVANTESQITEILNFLQLPWEDNCMEFYKTKRVIRTASAAQVTKKIYTNASLRYKKYGKSLERLAISLNIA
ncbi:tetratricopeptide repeat-containing sulfotransferase family protein [Marinicella litoralis]|uniref:Tetratricopeptide repeat protein n=1 Tax=Marinicella litoralis TaxID=644220 RepID=A0A4R6XXG7_9GAMM|nr:sulfotransferase [Marinicella litoralis]TDR23160.1 tetratricopeptide repeat protein [Marinicella litoralis]